MAGSIYLDDELSLSLDNSRFTNTNVHLLLNSVIQLSYSILIEQHIKKVFYSNKYLKLPVRALELYLANLVTITALHNRVRLDY